MTWLWNHRTVEQETVGGNDLPWIAEVSWMEKGKYGLAVHQVTARVGLASRTLTHPDDLEKTITKAKRWCEELLTKEYTQ